jgi:Domain of unknown function (DUF4440)
VLRAATTLLPLLVTLATGSVRSQASAANREDWKAAARVWAPDLVGWYPGQPDDTYAREMERLAHPKPAGARTRYAVNVVEVMVSGPMARHLALHHVPRLRRFDPSASPAATKSGRDSRINQWKIARWISAPEPPQSP